MLAPMGTRASSGEGVPPGSDASFLRAGSRALGRCGVNARRALCIGVVGAMFTAACTAGNGAASDRANGDGPATSATTTTEPAPTTLVPPDGKTSADRTLSFEREIIGELTPKSIVWSGTDRFIAQNMIYNHTISVYDRSYNRLALIPDTIRLADYGFAEYPGEYLGGPVEAAFTSDGRRS